jgi:hypothetical protein
LLRMYVRGDVMKGVLTFRIFIEILSNPWEFLDFSDLIIFSVSLGIIYFSFMFEQGSLKFYEDDVCDCYNLMKFYHS